MSALSGQPRGTIRVTAPLGLGRRFIASGIPDFHDKYPDIRVRLRLSDHNVDILKEGIDVAFRLGIIEDLSLRMRGIMQCERVLVASPAYLEARGVPTTPDELIDDRHDCLMLRFPGAKEHYWMLQTKGGLSKFEVSGPFDTDDGDVLTSWALDGRGIASKPRFEIEPFLREGRLKIVLPDNAPSPIQFAAVYPHKKLQDPKVRLLLDFMADRCERMIRGALAGR